MLTVQEDGRRGMRRRPLANMGKGQRESIASVKTRDVPKSESRLRYAEGGDDKKRDRRGM